MVIVSAIGDVGANLFAPSRMEFTVRMNSHLHDAAETMTMEPIPAVTPIRHDLPSTAVTLRPVAVAAHERRDARHTQAR